MGVVEVSNEVKEINLAYLMLAQQMLRLDRDAAIFRLGVSEEVASLLERLTPGQLLRMAASHMLLFRFRFDDRMLVDLLSNHQRESASARVHAAILAADHPVESFA